MNNGGTRYDSMNNDNGAIDRILECDSEEGIKDILQNSQSVNELKDFVADDKTKLAKLEELGRKIADNADNADNNISGALMAVLILLSANKERPKWGQHCVAAPCCNKKTLEMISGISVGEKLNTLQMQSIKECYRNFHGKCNETTRTTLRAAHNAVVIEHKLMNRNERRVLTGGIAGTAIGGILLIAQHFTLPVKDCHYETEGYMVVQKCTDTYNNNAGGVGWFALSASIPVLVKTAYTWARKKISCCATTFDALFTAVRDIAPDNLNITHHTHSVINSNNASHRGGGGGGYGTHNNNHCCDGRV